MDFKNKDIIAASAKLSKGSLCSTYTINFIVVFIYLSFLQCDITFITLQFPFLGNKQLHGGICMSSITEAFKLYLRRIEVLYARA